MQLRLVTWNLHGPPLARRQKERFREAAQHILGSTPPLPDLVLLQEVWFRSAAAHLIEILGPHYQAIDVPPTSFPGRAGGLLTLLRRDSGWSLAEHAFEAFRSNAPAWRIWEGDGMASKGVQQLTITSGSQRVVVLNTHLQAQYGERSYPEVRAGQVHQLNTLVRKIPSELPIVIAGDFNTRPSEELYTRLTDTWIDLTEGLRQRCTCGTTVADDKPEEWIDYVFVRRIPGWRVHAERTERLECTTVDAPSDHHGLDVTVSWTPSGSLAKAATVLALAAVHGPSTRRQWLFGCAALMLTRLRRDRSVAAEPRHGSGG